MGDRQSIHPGNRPIASGLLIAIAGSPLGVLSIVLVMAAGELITTQKWSKIAGLFRTFFDTLLPFSYIFGGIPAVLAGLLIGVALYRNGWVGWAYWIVVTFSLGIAAIFIADLIGVLKMRLFQQKMVLELYILLQHTVRPTFLQLKKTKFLLCVVSMITAYF